MGKRVKSAPPAVGEGRMKRFVGWLTGALHDDPSACIDMRLTMTIIVARQNIAGTITQGKARVKAPRRLVATSYAMA